MAARAAPWVVACAALLSTAAAADPIEQGLDVAGKATAKIIDSGGTIGSVLVLVALASVCLHVLQAYAIVNLYKSIQSLQDKRAQEAVESTRQVAAASIAGTTAIAESSTRLTEQGTRIQTLAERTLPLNEAMARMETAFTKLNERLMSSGGIQHNRGS